MKTVLIALFSLFGYSNLESQPKPETASIRGTLYNGENKVIYFQNDQFRDSVKTDQLGRFHYDFKNLEIPDVVYLKMGRSIYEPLYIAPGFELIIKGNVKNESTFSESVTISGRGAQANQFWIALDKYNKSRSLQPLTDAWYDLPTGKFLQEGLQIHKADSFRNIITHQIFNNDNKDPYASSFHKYSINYLKYSNLWNLFKYAEWNGIKSDVVDSLIWKLTGERSLTDLLNADAMLDDSHFKEVCRYDYIQHLVSMRKIKSESNFGEWTYPVEIADAIYTGAVREYALNELIRSGIRNTFRYSDINFFNRYILQIPGAADRTKLTAFQKERENELKDISAGKEMPDFRLQDDEGKLHSMSSFRGKVILMDLWASWCGPCKQQMPFLKEIQNKYLAANDFQIMSIAVMDEGGDQARKKFTEKNNFNWLHLKDTNHIVSDYLKVNAIPRFILIGKDGKFISSDAPFPGDNKAKLIRMIDEALRE